MIIIGIAGGSGAGKTFLTNKLKEIFENEIEIISQDNYYKPYYELTIEQRKIIRDVAERGRNERDIIEYVVNVSNPAHDTYVRETMKFTDLIVSDEEQAKPEGRLQSRQYAG